jgi:hypothetical protein
MSPRPRGTEDDGQLPPGCPGQPLAARASDLMIGAAERVLSSLAQPNSSAKDLAQDIRVADGVAVSVVVEVGVDVFAVSGPFTDAVGPPSQVSGV